MPVLNTSWMVSCGLVFQLNAISPICLVNQGLQCTSIDECHPSFDHQLIKCSFKHEELIRDPNLYACNA